MAFDGLSRVKKPVIVGERNQCRNKAKLSVLVISFSTTTSPL